MGMQTISSNEPGPQPALPVMIADLSTGPSGRYLQTRRCPRCARRHLHGIVDPHVEIRRMGPCGLAYRLRWSGKEIGYAVVEEIQVRQLGERIRQIQAAHDRARLN